MLQQMCEAPSFSFLTPRIVYTGMWLAREESAYCTRCCTMLAAPSSCNQAYGRCAHHLSERAHVQIPGLSTANHFQEHTTHMIGLGAGPSHASHPPPRPTGLPGEPRRPYLPPAQQYPCWGNQLQEPHEPLICEKLGKIPTMGVRQDSTEPYAHASGLHWAACNPTGTAGNGEVGCHTQASRHDASWNTVSNDDAMQMCRL
jgi:hypothetical protein